MRKAALSTLLICLSFLSFSQSENFYVHFNFNSDKLLPEAMMQLDSFLAVREPITLYGHTDSRGSSDYNMALSRRRIQAVKEYLSSKGYPADFFLEENPLGKTKLLQADAGDEIKSLANRRVEIVKRPKVSEDKPLEKTVSVSEEKTERTIKEILEDTAVKKGTVVTVNNLQFEGGRHRILISSLPQLRDLLDALKSNNKLEIAIQGHICCLPDSKDGLDVETYTQDLSFQRAKAIYEYLVYSGIDRSRLSYAGFGHSAPLYPYPEKNPEQKIANRRVEIKILDK